MPLHQMPNGEYVDLPADITPEGFAKVSAKYAAPANSPSAVPSGAAADARAKDDAADVERFKAGMNGPFGKPAGALGALKDQAVHSASFGLDNVVGPGMAALTQGAYRAAKTGDVGEVGRTYHNAREAGRQHLDEESEQHPIAGIAGQIAGLFANPVGAETGAGALVTKVGQYVPAVERAAQAVKASKVGQGIAKVGGTGLGLGARAGAIQGGLTGLSDTGNVHDALNEAGMGALGGAVVGGLASGVGGAVKLVRAHSAKGASDAAYDKIASLLSRSEDPTTGRPFTPQTAIHEIKASDANGGNAMLGDLTPEGQGWMSYLAKQPGLKSANHIVNTATERMEGAADRFDARVKQVLGIKDPDAYESTKAITAARKAAGQRDYSPDVMNRQLAWSDDLQHFFSKDNPAVQKALAHAEDLIRADDGDVSQLAFTNHKDPTKGMMQHVPSMGTMQTVIQGFDAAIGDAMKAGNTNLARIYSKQNRMLKDAVGKVNPEFKAANANQRDLFERAQSTELGQKILGHLKAGEGRQVLDMIKAGNVKPDDLKIGFADALLQLRRSGNGDPVVLMRKFMRHDDDRNVLSHMLGGNKTLNEFEQFMRRETRAMRTDKLVSSGRQMAANLLKEPTSGDAAELFSDVAKSGGQGMAFGGPVGAASRIARSVGAWDKTMSGAAKNELGRILGGKGDDVAKGVARSAAYKRIAERRMKRGATKLGKVIPAATTGGYSDQGD